MKRIEAQTFYELLEVRPRATRKEIQIAFDRARETFHTDSLAVYSLFSEKEIRDIRGRIEEAYRVLMDEGLRKAYDQSYLSPEDLMEGHDLSASPEVNAKSHEIPSSLPSVPEAVLDQEATSYRGRTLKRMREESGMDLKAMSSNTKINPRVLEWIEGEALDKLPAEVYLKGFLKAYAMCLRLDPKKVIDGYLQFVKENHGR